MQGIISSVILFLPIWEEHGFSPSPSPPLSFVEISEGEERVTPLSNPQIKGIVSFLLCGDFPPCRIPVEESVKALSPFL